MYTKWKHDQIRVVGGEFQQIGPDAFFRLPKLSLMAIENPAACSGVCRQVLDLC